tara:strand:- start:2159 stop:2341 length:183 start_codon:yes stop_codon:yes gene_type:complete
MVRMSRPTVTEVKTQIDTHEAICAERWQETINRIKRLEMVILGSGGAIILLLVNIIVFGG